VNKFHERLQLQKVFGSLVAASADGGERPDFIIETSSAVKLGVEVTSIYMNNTDAKLRHVADYQSSLLDGNGSIHLSDRGKFDLGDIEIIDQDGNHVSKLKAIVRQVPTMEERIDNLFTVIRGKEAKVKDYLKKCECVDLIIKDESNLFLHESHEQLYELFHKLMPKKELLNSSFREIYLITTTENNKELLFPLRANFFASDCFAYVSLIAAKRASVRFKELAELLSACLLLEGYTDAKMSLGDSTAGFFFGAWEMHYWPEGQSLRDWRLIHEVYNGELIQITNARNLPNTIKKAKRLVAKRTLLYSSVEVSLPVHIN
jgi:hypothetical protein